MHCRSQLGTLTANRRPSIPERTAVMLAASVCGEMSKWNPSTLGYCLRVHLSLFGAEPLRPLCCSLVTVSLRSPRLVSFRLPSWLVRRPGEI